jgi:hypothetical protein
MTRIWSEHTEQIQNTKSQRKTAGTNRKFKNAKKNSGCGTQLSTQFKEVSSIIESTSKKINCGFEKQPFNTSSGVLLLLLLLPLLLVPASFFCR